MDTPLPQSLQSIATRCPQCSRKGHLPPQAVGHFIRCPACKHRFMVTSGGTPIQAAVFGEPVEEVPTVETIEEVAEVEAVEEEIPVVGVAEVAAVEVEVIEVVDVEVV